MDIYGEKSSALPQKLVVTALETLLLVASAWILFGDGGVMLAGWFSWPIPIEIPTRRIVIFGFSVVILARMAFTMFYLMKRAMPWSEAFTVPFAFALYYIGFAILVLPSQAALGVWDWVAMALFVLGCTLNTGSELQRHLFKAKTENKGKLYTGGLFSRSMHINFFGDVLWVLAYALVTQSMWSVLIVAFIFSFFAFYNVPMLDTYLANHYGEDFKAYAAQTKKLVPFIW